MASVSSEYKALFVRNLCWLAKDTSPEQSVADVLKTLSRAKFKQTKDGLVVTATSGNGHSIAFSIPDGGYSPSDMADLCGEMWRRYDEAVAELQEDDSGSGTPTNADICEEMLRGIGLPIRRESDHYGDLRMGPCWRGTDSCDEERNIS